MSETSIKVQLELIDKSAQKALGDFIAKSDKADTSINKLNKSHSALQGKVDDTSASFTGLVNIITKDIGGRGASAVGGLSELIGGRLLGAIGVVSVAAGILKTALDLTFLAERNSQIENSFNALAASAGLAGDALREGLVAAAGGLVDDTDLMAAANKSIIELGDNAGQIPHIMELSRKATALFGGDLIQNFEAMSQAIANGNVKMLKQYGLVIDTQDAERKFAESLGVTADRLSEVGKKQAIANAALEKADQKFKDIDENSTKATQSFQHLKAASSGLVDALADAAKKSSFFSSIFNAMSDAADSATAAIKSRFGEGLENATYKVRVSQDRIKQLEQTLKELQGRLEYTPKDAGLIQAIEGTKNILATTRIEADDLQKALVRLTSAKPVDAPKQDKSKFITPDNESEKYGKKILEEANNADAVAKIRMDALKAQKDQDLVTEQEYQDKQQEIVQAAFLADMKRLQDSKLANEDYLKARDFLTAKFSSEQAKRDVENKKNKDKLLEAEVHAVGETFGNLASLMKTNSRELFEIGKAAAIASSTINTYEAITKTMASVPYPFNIPLAAAQGIAGFVQVSNIASQQPQFEQGGIVGGNSFTGDNISARVNSGEMILNRSQQSELFKVANGSGGGNLELKLDALINLIAAKDDRIVVNIGGKTVVESLRSEIASGRSFT